MRSSFRHINLAGEGRRGTVLWLRLLPHRRCAPARRRPRAGATCGNRKYCRNCRNGRRSCCREGPARGGTHGVVSLAGRNGGGDRACLARRCVLRRWRVKVTEYVLLRPLLHRSASVAYGFGYGGFRGIVGFGLFVGKVQRSHVLSAMGVEPALAMGAIRVSLGWNSRREDCVSFVQALVKTVKSIQARRDKPAA